MVGATTAVGTRVAVPDLACRGVRIVSASSISATGRSGATECGVACPAEGWWLRGTSSVSASTIAAPRSGRGAGADVHSIDDARRLARGCRTASEASPSRSSGASAAVMRRPTTSEKSARCQGRIPWASNLRVPPGDVRSTTASPRTTAVTSEGSLPGHQTIANESTETAGPTGTHPTRVSMLTRASLAASASAVVQASGAGAARAAMNRSPTTMSHAAAPGSAALVTDPATMATSLASVACRASADVVSSPCDADAVLEPWSSTALARGHPSSWQIDVHALESVVHGADFDGFAC